MKEINEERKVIYSLLARIFRKEADAELLNSLKQFDYSSFNNESDDNIDKGFLLMEKFAKRIKTSTALDLARDYARTFIGAGLGKGEGAYPYESYYTSPDRLLMQDARDKVMFAYGDEMLKISENFTEPEDHVAFEFEFMAFLCNKAIEAIDNNNNDETEKYMEKQKAFFVNHINRWVDMFCDDVVKVAKEDFYKATAIITKGVLEEERYLFGLK